MQRNRRIGCSMIREKVDLAAQLQRSWSDNQVSCTAEFDPETEADDVPRVLSAYEDRLKAMVFLPAVRHGYEQPQYEEISRKQYDSMVRDIRPLRGRLPHEHEFESRFCDGDLCEIGPVSP